jgi:uncharacterized protein YkwD
MPAGWRSPGHRENILTEGLEAFGFGISGEDGKVYAVQTFAGPGTPPQLGPDEEPVVLARDEQPAQALRAVNRERERQGLTPIEGSETLDQVARQLLPEDMAGERLISQSNNLFGLLPSGQARAWSTLAVMAAACGGCGKVPTAADIRHFADQWVNNPQHHETLLGQAISHLGFAMLANGEGRKVAIAIAGRRR